MTLAWEWLGRASYGVCLEAQRARRDAVIRGVGHEVVWLVEHPRTITVGRRPAPGTPSREALAKQGIDFAKVERGGLATWHGPGQLVAYPIVSLTRRGFTVRGYVHRLEQVVIEWLQAMHVQASRKPGLPGVWVGDAKIAALGVHIRRGVSIHGVAINIAPDLRDYGCIVPCGLEGLGVTSLAEVIGPTPGIEKMALDLGPKLALRLSTH